MTLSIFSRLPSIRNLLGRKSQPEADADAPHIEMKEFVVRDVDEPDLGIQAINSCELDGYVTHGVGFEFSDAADEIEERVDLEEHVGEHVATVYVDVREKTYLVEYHVGDRSVVDTMIGGVEA